MLNRSFAGIVSSTGAHQDISFEVKYREGLDVQDVTKRLIAHLIDSVEAYARVQEKQRIYVELGRVVNE